jgi:hypothetical protein
VPPNPIKALATYLLADADIYALTEDRVFAAAIPDTETANMPQYAVLLQPAGGMGSVRFSKQYQIRVDVRCYGSDADQAFDLQQTCFDILKDLNRYTDPTGCLIYTCDRISGPNQSRDPATHWPCNFGTYLVQTHLEEIL